MNTEQKPSLPAREKNKNKRQDDQLSITLKELSHRFVQDLLHNSDILQFLFSTLISLELEKLLSKSRKIGTKEEAIVLIRKQWVEYKEKQFDLVEGSRIWLLFKEEK